MHTIAFFPSIAAVIFYFTIYNVWTDLISPYKLDDMLIDAYDYGKAGNKLKGKPKYISARFRRYMNQADFLLVPCLLSILSVLIRMFQSALITTIVLFVTATLLQINTQTNDATAFIQNIIGVSRLLLLGLIDELSFDLFSIIEITLKPHFNNIEERAIAYGFYTLETVILVQTFVMCLANTWTGIACLIFPEPALRLANNDFEPEDGSLIQFILKHITAL